MNIRNAIARLVLMSVLSCSLWTLAADVPKPEIVIVYWSSKDCHWCTYWESSLSGMERRFKESEEFKKVTYRVVKNERLADQYNLEHFPSDIAWVHERMQRSEERRPGRPGWVIYVDRKRVAAFYGTRDWEEKHLPEIKRIVTANVGK